MQPYFFPYIGYFQLINAVDEFVLYDNIQYTKKGWVNRNKILTKKNDVYISIPLKKDSDYLNINQRYLADNWSVKCKKMLNIITDSYRKAPQFEIVFPFLESCLLVEEANLSDFINNSLQKTLSFLSIDTKITISSNIDIDFNLKNENKVITICKVQGAKIYINPIGGIHMYCKETFKQKGLELQFQKSNPINYPQFTKEFVPWLSIIDVLMFNEKDDIMSFLNDYQII